MIGVDDFFSQFIPHLGSAEHLVDKGLHMRVLHQLLKRKGFEGLVCLSRVI